MTDTVLTNYQDSMNKQLDYFLAVSQREELFNHFHKILEDSRQAAQMVEVLDGFANDYNIGTESLNTGEPDHQKQIDAIDILYKTPDTEKYIDNWTLLVYRSNLINKQHSTDKKNANTPISSGRPPLKRRTALIKLIYRNYPSGMATKTRDGHLEKTVRYMFDYLEIPTTQDLNEVIRNALK